jgi:hypothetical protein
LTHIRIAGFGYECAASAGCLTGLADIGDPVWGLDDNLDKVRIVNGLSPAVEVGLKIAQGRECEMVLRYGS